MNARSIRAWSLLIAAASARTFAAAATPPAADNVVLIVVDAMRQDRLSAYGNPRKTSPAFDALAQDGALFMNVEAQSNWTMPALASIMTSLYPSVHGAVDPLSEVRWPSESEKGLLNPPAGSRLDESRMTLAEILRRAGWTTAGIVSCSFCQAAFGFDHGFQTYQGAKQDAHAKLQELNDLSILPWIKNHRRQKFFLYVHVYDVHAPYDTTPYYNRLWDPGYRGTMDGSRATLDEIGAGRALPARDLQHLIALYDGGISYTDSQIARIIGELKSLDLYRRTLVVVTADHGESFHEHGTIMQHGKSAYETELRVPLIMKVPGRKIGTRVSSVTQAVDIAPTVLDVLGITPPPGFQGRSVLPLLNGIAPAGGREDPAFSQSIDDSYPRTAVAVRQGRWKLIRHEGSAPTTELYDLISDPGEQADLARERPQIAVRLGRLLDEWEKRNAAAAAALPALSPNAPISRDIGAFLKAAGYIQ